jgi:hypothetical protein
MCAFCPIPDGQTIIEDFGATTGKWYAVLACIVWIVIARIGAGYGFRYKRFVTRQRSRTVLAFGVSVFLLALGVANSTSTQLSAYVQQTRRLSTPVVGQEVIRISRMEVCCLLVCKWSHLVVGCRVSSCLAQVQAHDMKTCRM